MRASFGVAFCAVALLGCKHGSTNSTGGTTGGADGGDSGACITGAPTVTPAPLVTGLSSPWALAVDDSAIYWTEYGDDPAIKRAAKADGSGSVTLATPLAEALLVDDTSLYYRAGGTLARLSKSSPGPATTLSSGYDDLHSKGLFSDGTWLYFAGDDSAHGDQAVLMRMQLDGTNPLQLASAASPILLVGIDADNAYYSVEAITFPASAQQLSVPLGGGASTVLATGSPCFNGAIDADYFYCTGNTPFKLRLRGTSDQVPLCQSAGFAFVDTDTQGSLALAGGQLFLFVVPDSDDSNAGHIVEVSGYGGGHTLAAGIDQPRVSIADGDTLYYTENAKGMIMRLAVTP